MSTGTDTTHPEPDDVFESDVIGAEITRPVEQYPDFCIFEPEVMKQRFSPRSSFPPAVGEERPGTSVGIVHPLPSPTEVPSLCGSNISSVDTSPTRRPGGEHAVFVPSVASFTHFEDMGFPSGGEPIFPFDNSFLADEHSARASASDSETWSETLSSDDDDALLSPQFQPHLSLAVKYLYEYFTDWKKFAGHRARGDGQGNCQRGASFLSSTTSLLTQATSGDSRKGSGKRRADEG